MCSIHPKKCAHHRSVHLRSAGISSAPGASPLCSSSWPCCFFLCFRNMPAVSQKCCLVPKTALGCAPQKKWFLSPNSKEAGVKNQMHRPWPPRRESEGRCLDSVIFKAGRDFGKKREPRCQTNNLSGRTRPPNNPSLFLALRLLCKYNQLGWQGVPARDFLCRVEHGRPWTKMYSDVSLLHVPIPSHPDSPRSAPYLDQMRWSMLRAIWQSSLLLHPAGDNQPLL